MYFRLQTLNVFLGVSSKRLGVNRPASPLESQQEVLVTACVLSPP